MKNIHRTIRAWFVCLLAMFATLPVSADVTIDQLEFTEVEGGYSVKAKMDDCCPPEGKLVISETYNGEPVVEIEDAAFSHCYGLTSVTIPEGVITIGERAFEYCYGLTSVTIPEGVITIGGQAFELCNSLSDVTIPNSVKTIGSHSFHCCAGLTSVTIGSGTNSIEANAFYGCGNIKELTCFAVTPPMLSIYGSFDFYPNSEPTIYVPEESVDAYRQHDEWGKFRHIVGRNLTGVGAIETEAAEVGAVEIYGLDGVRHPEGIEKLRPGNYVVRQGGMSRKIYVR